MHWIKPITHVFSPAVLCSMFLLQACSTSKDALLANTDYPTMREVYQEQVGGNPEVLPVIRQQGRETPLLQAQRLPKFSTVANPTLQVYIWPHTRGEAPIPGYYTQIKLYPREHFALPGEALHPRQGD